MGVWLRFHGGAPAETAKELAAWFRARQFERDAGKLPLCGRWWDV